MRLRLLRIERLPGIAPGFELSDLGPGVNLISGPNASGKSSLIRALKYLLAGPDAADPAMLSLDAEFGNGGRWSVTRQGSDVQWRHDGRDAPPPRLPDRDALSGYWLTMENLLSKDTTDKDLEATLYRALSGGFDLEALKAELFGLGPQHGQREYRTFLTARNALSEQVSESRALQRDEAELPALRTRIAEARAAAEQAAALARALEWLDLREQQRSLTAQLQNFPPAMSRLHGDEIERLDVLESDLARIDEAMRGAVQQQSDARRDLADSGLAAGAPAESELATQQAALQRLRELGQHHDDCQQQLQQAESDLDMAVKQLGGQDPDQGLSFTPEHLQRAERLVRELLQARKHCAELQAQLDDLPEPVAEHELLSLQQGAELLRGWLAAHALNQQWPWGALAAVLGGVVAAGVGAYHQLWVAAAGGLIAATGGAMSWWQRRALLGKTRADYLSGDLSPPEQWTLDAVRARRNVLESQLIRAREQNVRIARQEGLQQSLAQAQAEARQLEDAHQALAQEIGFEPQQAVLNLDLFLRHLAQYQDAGRRRDLAHRHLGALTAERVALAETLQQFLAGWGETVSSDVAALATGLDSLQQRCRDARSARDKLTRAQQAKADAQGRYAQRQQEVLALYEHAGLPDGDRQALMACLERLDDWRRLKREADQLVGRIQSVRANLAGQEAVLALVEQDDRAELLEQQAQAKAAAQRLDDLTEEAGRLTERLAQAGREHRLEQAQAEVDQGQAHLQDVLDSWLLKHTGQFLLDEVSAAYHHDHEPALLSEGRRRFQQFTHHGWDLMLDKAAGLLATEQASGDKFTLSELSTGTRIQLLLAMRTARLAYLEQGRESLPLFLDEALTTSDETRFAAVARALHALANVEDRQVFYLSARRQELGLWQAVTGQQPHHIDLAALRFGEAVAADDLAVSRLPEVPLPGPLSSEAYGTLLGVPAVDPTLPAGKLHLFHLLRDDLTLLHHLLSAWRVENLGQLELLLGSDAVVNAIPDADTRSKLVARCRLARHWLAAWQQGRGRPVDRTVLAASGAVSDAFIDPASELVAALEGDGRALIAGMRRGEVPRFRKEKIDELEAWLETEGYIDSAPVLNAGERLQTTLLSADDATESGAAVQRLVGWLEAGCAARPHAVTDTEARPDNGSEA